MSPLQAWRWT